MHTWIKLQLSAPGLFKHVSPFSGYQVLRVKRKHFWINMDRNPIVNHMNNYRMLPIKSHFKGSSQN